MHYFCIDFFLEAGNEHIFLDQDDLMAVVMLGAELHRQFQTPINQYLEQQILR